MKFDSEAKINVIYSIEPYPSSKGITFFMAQFF